MKKVLLIITILLSIIFLKLGTTYLFNEIIIKDYENNKYDNNLINTLYLLNFNEPYIAYYNHGNLLYRLEEYEEAINKYEKALTKHPNEDRICDIRINLSLSYLQTIDENDSEKSLSILKEAKEILYEDDCASIDDDNGKSSKAEDLEEEIKKLEEQLKGNEEPSDPNDPNNEKPKEEPSVPKNVEEQLKEQQKQNHQSREEDMDYYNEINNSSYYNGKYW